MLYEFITQGCCTLARPHRSFVAFRPFGEVSSVIRGLVCLTHTSSAQVSARVTVRGRPCKRGPHQARTRPAPGFFSELRSWSEAGSAASVLEPAPGPHQARKAVALVPRNWKQAYFFGVACVEFPGSASTCPGQVRRNFTGQLEKFFAEVVGLDDNLDFFFPGKNPDLGAGYAGQAGGFYAGQLGPRSHWQKKLQVLPHDNLDILGRTGFYFFLVCRAGWAMPGRFAETVGLDDSFEIFFLGRIPTLAGLCRAGAAGGALGVEPLGEP